MSKERARAVKNGKYKRILSVFGVILMLPILGAGFLFFTFKPDDYRQEISAFLSEKLGRKVELRGKMHLQLAGGPALAIADVVIANPSWASRPELAKIGQLNLAVKLKPLLATPRRLEVESVKLLDSDIQLETNTTGQKNWEMTAASPAPNPTAATGKSNTSKQALQIALDLVTMRNVRLAFRSGAAPATEFKIKNLDLTARGQKTDIRLDAQLNDQPVKLSLNGAALMDIMVDKAWPFTMTAAALGNDFSGKGALQNLGKRLEFSDFTLKSSIGSTITGNLLVKTGGARPDLSGTLKIDRLAPPAGGGNAAPAPATDKTAASTAAADSRFIFKDTKFDLTALNAVDANLTGSIGTIAAGGLNLQNTQFSLSLRNGQLTVAPLSTELEKNRLQATLSANAATQAVGMTLRGEALNLQPVLQILGITAITPGRTDLTLDFKSRGNSPRQIASALDGSVILRVGRSTLPTAQLGAVTVNALRLLKPNLDLGAEQRLTCATFRFKANDGIMTSDGMLLDTSLATVAGQGTIDLRQEMLKLAFQPQAKDAALNTLASPIFVNGPLTQPAIKMDRVGAVAGLAQNLLGKSLPTDLGAKPIMQVPLVNEQLPDPCTAALDNPTYANPAEAAPTSAAGMALEKGKQVVQDKVKGLTDKLNKSLGDKAPPELKNLLGGEDSPLKGLFGQ
jgi:AsmA family protein